MGAAPGFMGAFDSRIYGRSSHGSQYSYGLFLNKNIFDQNFFIDIFD